MDANRRKSSERSQCHHRIRRKKKQNVEFSFLVVIIRFRYSEKMNDENITIIPIFNDFSFEY
jgi:hypothetical protein